MLTACPQAMFGQNGKQGNTSRFGTLKIHFNANQNSFDTELSVMENIASMIRNLRPFTQEFVKK
jgi:hypothetical protein